MTIFYTWADVVWFMFVFVGCSCILGWLLIEAYEYIKEWRKRYQIEEEKERIREQGKNNNPKLVKKGGEK